MNQEANYDKPILQLVGIDKKFPGVHAVNHIDLTLYENEILGISGENGAGKSTLLKMISGVYHPDEGRIIFQGKERNLKSPQDSIREGISIIYQELSDLGNLTVAENIFLGRLPLSCGIVNWKKLNADAGAFLNKYGIDISPTRTMKSLSMTEKQLVEITKAVSTDSRIIIMDEPTSSLGLENVARLMGIIRKVHSDGIAFIFISHRLDELIEICHRIVVLRDGQNVAEFSKEEFDVNSIVEKMVGHSMKEFYTKQKIETGEVILKLDHITTNELNEVSLEVEKGSIVGLYGMAGAGQERILEAIFGVNSKWTGNMQLFGRDYHPLNPRDAINRKVCYITEDRKGTGLSLKQNVADNFVMGNLSSFQSKGLIDWSKIRSNAKKWIDSLLIKTPSINTKVESLSGGNQQKVILARWIQREPKLILFNEPTRGIDVGTKHELFQIVQDLCKTGVSVLMISSDMLEMLSIADKIYVVCEGNITACFDHNDVSQNKLMKAAVNILE